MNYDYNVNSFSIHSIPQLSNDPRFVSSPQHLRMNKNKEFFNGRRVTEYTKHQLTAIHDLTLFALTHTGLQHNQPQTLPITCYLRSKEAIEVAGGFWIRVKPIDNYSFSIRDSTNRQDINIDLTKTNWITTINVMRSITSIAQSFFWMNYENIDLFNENNFKNKKLNKGITFTRWYENGYNNMFNYNNKLLNNDKNNESRGWSYTGGFKKATGFTEVHPSRFRNNSNNNNYNNN